jgi:hypothetical protein
MRNINEFPLGNVKAGNPFARSAAQLGAGGLSPSLLTPI